MSKLKIDDRMRMDWLQWFIYDERNDLHGHWLRLQDKSLRKVIDKCIIDGRFGLWQPKK